MHIPVSGYYGIYDKLAVFFLEQIDHQINNGSFKYEKVPSTAEIPMFNNKEELKVG